MVIVPLSILVQPTAAENWWNPGWNYRETVVVNHTQVNATLLSFPVLIDVVDANLVNKTQASGNDIVFVGSDNGTFNHEIEFYDGTVGHLVAWVRVPQLSSTQDTTFYMYYGNPSAQNQQNPNGVWDANFTMVQHLDETGVSRFDSTTNKNNGTAYGVSKGLGKIDGADVFNGVNSYLRVADAPSLDPSSTIMVELWMNLSSTNDYINLISKGSYDQFYLRLGSGYGSNSSGNAYWSVKFSDGNVSVIEGNVGWAWNMWHYVVATLDTNAQVMRIYVDGVLKLSGTFASGKSIAATSNPILISNPSSRQIKGIIEEIRVSNAARSNAYIQTSYMNQKSPSTFCAVGFPETNPIPPANILIYDANPANETTGTYTNPTLSIRAVDLNGGTMNITFVERVSGNWIDIGDYIGKDGVYSTISENVTSLGSTYYWGVYVTDGTNSTSNYYSFTTTTKILTQKWFVNSAWSGVSGALIADVNGDGTQEVIQAGQGGVVALNGTNGNVVWNVSDSGIGDHCQPAIANLDGDGDLETVVPLQSPAGVLVLYGNGSTYWRRTDLGGDMFSGPVVFDIDGSGHPTIFAASTDALSGLGLNGTGRITALSYNGTILRQTFAWRPCSGGLSIADVDGTGRFTLFMGDRYMYLNSSEYGDNDYGKGVSAYWATNLTLRWYRPEIFCSSQKPILADVNNDGKLEVVIGDMNGGAWVLNATDGSTINAIPGVPYVLPTHYQPSVYDIDGDGHLEMLMADPHDTASSDLVVLDLVTWKVKASIYIGKNFYGPQLADVDGDGHMEIIACNYGSILIIDRTYRVIDGIVGLSGGVISQGTPENIDGLAGLTGTLNYAVVQDIDGDGYNEVVVTSQSGTVYAFDTPARTPYPRPRTEVQFYSEYRRGAAEYVQPQTTQSPVISSLYPLNSATAVPVSTSQLSFTLTDYQRNLMNYTVTTYPNIGSSNVQNAGNGRCYLNVSNLQYSTMYAWTVNATDGLHQTNAAYVFTTEDLPAQVPWWNQAWPYRKAITIDHNKVAADLASVPILVDTTDSDLIGKTQPDGKDIVFTDVNGTKLNHEIESYDNNTGHLVAWVNIPNVSSTADTKLYMYYGNTSASNQQNPAAVWDSNFMMVQHLKEKGQNRFDSTANANNGTFYGGIAKGVRIDGADTFANATNYIVVPDSPSLNPSSAITIELWMNLSSTGNYINIVNKGNYAQYYLRLGPQAGYAYWYVKFSDGTAKSIEGNIGWVFGAWHYLVATLDTQAQTMTVYLDGVQELTGTFGSGKTIVATSNSIMISDLGQRPITGVIDEVRISNVVRSAAWIQTSFNNEKGQSTFLTIGSEELIPQAPQVFSPTPSYKATNVLPSLSQLSFNLTDYQGSLMNYTVASYPDITSGLVSGLNVSSGMYTVNVSGLQYFTTYTWTVNVTDGVHWTNMTFSFSTLPSVPPTQATPLLVQSGTGDLTCYNQTTYDPYSNVTNIYNWYRNGTSLTNLLLPFDTNSSTTATDYSGYNNNGQIIGGVSWVSNGKVGGAYNFNRGFIQIPGTSTLDGGGQWSEITVEEWIYLTAYENETRTIARIPSYEIGISGNTIYAGIWVVTGSPMLSGYHRVTYNQTLQTNTWYHVAFTYKSGASLTLYINGIPVGNQTVSGNIQPSGSNPLYIGWFDYFKGKIDEVAIYPRCLTPQQINQTYLDTNNGLSNSSTIMSLETRTGETWTCEVIPNDGNQDGIAKFSNPITIS